MMKFVTPILVRDKVCLFELYLTIDTNKVHRHVVRAL